MGLRPRWQVWWKSPWVVEKGRTSNRKALPPDRALLATGNQGRTPYVWALVPRNWVPGLRRPRAARARCRLPTTPYPGSRLTAPTGLRREPNFSVFRKRTSDRQRLGVVRRSWLARLELGGVKGCEPGFRPGWSTMDEAQPASGGGFRPGVDNPDDAQQPHLPGDQQVHFRVGAEGALLAPLGKFRTSGWCATSTPRSPRASPSSSLPAARRPVGPWR